jgi:hypothetical protein
VFFARAILFSDLAYVALYIWKGRRLGVDILRSTYFIGTSLYNAFYPVKPGIVCKPGVYAPGE